MTLLAGRAITTSPGSRLVLDGADLTAELPSHDRFFLHRATEGGSSAWLERRTAVAG